MATEDLTTYTEYDVNSHLTITSTKATAASVHGNETVYAIKDFGANYFDALDINFELYIESSASGNGRGGIGLSNIANVAINGFNSSSVSATIALGNDSVVRISLMRGAFTATDLYVGSHSTLYYCTLSRAAGNDTISLFIYSDASREILLDTLVVAGFSTVKYQYLYGFVNYNDSDSFMIFSGYVQNIDLGPVAKEDTLQFDLGIQIAKEDTFQFGIGTQIFKEDTFQFDIQANISKEDTLQFDIAILFKEDTLQFDLQANISKEDTLQFDIDYDVFLGMVLTCIISNTNRTNLEATLTATIQNPYCIKDVMMTCRIIETLADYLSTIHEISLLDNQFVKEDTLLFSIGDQIIKEDTLQFDIDDFVLVAKEDTLQFDVDNYFAAKEDILQFDLQAV